MTTDISLDEAVKLFLLYLARDPRAPKTEVEFHATVLAHFIALLKAHGRIQKTSQLESTTIQSYADYLAEQHGERGLVQRHIDVVRRFCNLLEEKGYCSSHVAHGVKVSRPGRKPPTTFAPYWRQRFFSVQIDENRPETVRDRALFELLFSGPRLDEISKLNVEDVNLKAGNIRINPGKKTERVVPLRKSAQTSLRDYLKVREQIPCRVDSDALFISNSGKMSEGAIRQAVEVRGRAIGCPFPVSPEILREALERQLLEEGLAPEAIRFVLGQVGRRAEAV